MSATAGSALVTIKNDDLPTLSIAGTTLDEGNSGSSNANLTVTLSSASSKTVTVNYASANGTATAGSDYVNSSGTLTFAPGETSKTLNVFVLGDTTVEANETFQVALTSPTNASLSSSVGSANVTLSNDDLPTLSIAGGSLSEGNSGSKDATLTVSLSSAAAVPVTVNYASQDGTAIAGSDYIATSNTLTFAPGETRKTITIPVIGDTTVEPDETLIVGLSSPSNAALSSNSSATLTISNDDSQAGISSLAITSATGIQNSTLNAGDVVNVTLTLSAATTVTGTPQLALNIGDATVQANYVSGSGSTALVFQYTVQAGQTDANGISIAANSLSLNGGTLKNATGTDVALSHAAVSDNAAYRVDTTAPVFTSTTTASVAENTASGTQIYDATADSDTGVSYGLSGTDAAKFTLDLSNGTVKLAFLPNYESPVDSGSNNVYDFNVRATDAAGNATDQAVAMSVTDVAEASPTSQAGQAVIDLGADYGKLINPVNVDGKWYYYWDRSGDGTSANTQGSGYTNTTDVTTHDWLDSLFRQDVNGVTGGGGNTTNTYRYATLNGVNVALPTVGEATLITGYRPGTVVGTGPDGEANPTYDDLLAIWDAYNGGGTGTGSNGTPSGWNLTSYWSATPSASGHALVYPGAGDVYDNDDYDTSYVALEVL